MNDSELIALLRAVIEISEPLDVLAERLQHADRDSEVEVEVTREDFRARMDDYLAGKLSTRNLEVWAYILMSRDQIMFEDGSPTIRNALVHLSNPAREGALARETVGTWLLKLQDEKTA
jgi:hypothetical protein